MTEPEQIIIYTTPTCPQCEELKTYMGKTGISYEEKDLTDFNNIAKLRQKGIFLSSAPILQIDNLYFNSLEIANKNFYSEVLCLLI